MKRLASHLLFVLPFVLACDPQESPDYEGEPRATMKGSITSSKAAPAEAEAAVLWLTGDGGTCEGPGLGCGYGFSAFGELDFSCPNACGEPTCDEASLQAWYDCVSACEGIEADEPDLDVEGCAAGGIGEQVALSVENFPGEFAMSLFDMPPEASFLRGSDQGPRVAMGFVLALSPDAPGTFDFENAPEAFDTILGAVTSHFIIYAADPVPADSLWGRYLGGSFDVGYHLIRYDAEIDCESEPECSIVSETIAPEPLEFDAEVEMELAPIGDIALPI